jgi:hypothetical protein
MIAIEQRESSHYLGSLPARPVGSRPTIAQRLQQADPYMIVWRSFGVDSTWTEGYMVVPRKFFFFLLFCTSWLMGQGHLLDFQHLWERWHRFGSEYWPDRVEVGLLMQAPKINGLQHTSESIKMRKNV